MTTLRGQQHVSVGPMLDYCDDKIIDSNTRRCCARVRRSCSYRLTAAHVRGRHGRPSAPSVRTRVLVNRTGSLACVDTIHGASVEGGPGTGLWEAAHLTPSAAQLVVVTSVACAGPASTSVGTRLPASRVCTRRDLPRKQPSRALPSRSNQVKHEGRTSMESTASTGPLEGAHDM